MPTTTTTPAGRARCGSPRILARRAAAQVFILPIPNLPEKGDVTDFFVEQQRTADELRALIRDATPFIVARAATAEASRSPS
jgi:hypothetical protein